MHSRLYGKDFDFGNPLEVELQQGKVGFLGINAIDRKPPEKVIARSRRVRTSISSGGGWRT